MYYARAQPAIRMPGVWDASKSTTTKRPYSRQTIGRHHCTNRTAKDGIAHKCSRSQSSAWEAHQKHIFSPPMSNITSGTRRGIHDTTRENIAQQTQKTSWTSSRIVLSLQSQTYWHLEHGSMKLYDFVDFLQYCRLLLCQ